MSTPHDPTQSFSPLDGVIADYLQSVEAGQVPNRQEFLDGHPELADDLRAFFADLDRMDRVAAPLRPADGLGATTDGGDDAPSLPASVRYFGDYELLEEVARGGMGIVYKARQASLNRVVALKMILRGAFATDREVARFRAEAEAAANLDHPHIVPIYEVGEHDGQQYYSMKFVDGSSLAGLARGDALAEVTGLLDITRAVYFAHQHGILHRDLKPSNVLVDSGGVRYVTDFGLAKRLTDTNRSLTQSGDMLGTPRYMAPEQAMGRKDLTIAADIYSLGVILYERLTGRAPFMADDVLTLLRQIRETEPARPSSIVAGLDRDLETICLKCLQKEPSRRYANAAALGDDLDHWLKGEPITARPVGRGERLKLWVRRHPTASALMGTSVVAAMAIAAAVLLTAYNGELKRANREIIDSRAKVQAAYASEAAARTRAEEAGKTAAKERAIAVTARDDAQKSLGLANQYLYILRINQSQSAWRENLAERASPLLDECPPEQRGWEWHYLNGQRHAPLREFQLPSGKVIALSYSVDGRRLAAAGDNGILKVWEVTTGQEVLSQRLTGQSPMLGAVAFSPDLRTVASADWDHRSAHLDFTVKVWDVDSGRELSSLREVDDETQAKATNLRPGNPPSPTFSFGGCSLAFSPDGRRIALSSCTNRNEQTDGQDRVFFYSQSVAVWDLASRQKLWVSRSHDDAARGGATAVKFSHDGRTLVASVRLDSTRVWDAETGHERFTIPGDMVCVLSPNGTFLAAKSVYSKVKLWTAETGELAKTLLENASDTDALEFSPDGRTIASSGRDRVVKIRGFPGGEERFTLRGHIGPVGVLAYSPDGRSLASGGSRGEVNVWDATAAPESATINSIPALSRLSLRGRGSSLAFSPDGRRIITATEGFYDNLSRVASVDLLTGSDTFVTKGYPARFRGFALSPDGRTITCADSKGTVITSDAETGHELMKLTGGSPVLELVVYSPDSRKIATNDGVRGVRISEVRTGREVTRFSVPNSAVAGVFSLDSRSLRTVDSDGKLTEWDVASGKAVSQTTANSGATDAANQRRGNRLTSVSFSPDGRYVAMAYSDNTIIEKAAVSGEEIAKLRGCTSMVTAMSYSPDGRRIVTADQNEVKVWDSATGQELINLGGRQVNSVAFSPDGRWIATDSTAGLKVWDATDVGPGRDSQRFARWNLQGAAWRRQQSQLSLYEENWFAAAHHIDHLVSSGHAGAEILTDRAIARAQLGRWDEALSDFAKVAASPDAPARALSIESLLCWSRGDVAGYQRSAESLLSRIALTHDPATIAEAAWVLVRIPGGFSNPARALELARSADRSMSDNPRAAMILGVALYRAGRYDEAVRAFDRVMKPPNKPLRTLLLLAMLHQRLGHLEEARRLLDKAAVLFRESESPDTYGARPPSWSDRLEVRMLRAEAEALILWDPIFPADPFAR